MKPKRSKLSYPEQIQRAFRRAARKRTPTEVFNRVTTPEMLYYSQAAKGVACVSWERFSGSWAGQQWIRRHFP
jgi:hypothetical protein